MRAVIQRVTRASVSVDGRTIGEIGPGLVVLVGVGQGDGAADVDYLVDKTVNLRIFEDEQEKMNLSLLDTGGAVLAISQFTLYGDARKGRRPSFSDAAPPAAGRALYEQYLGGLRAAGVRVAQGEFGAMMAVELVNDGPVTIMLDSKRTF
ncbi:MAG: D-aminoacyl-tRNA deacylase [Chloroflexota bacterium]